MAFLTVASTASAWNNYQLGDEQGNDYVNLSWKNDHYEGTFQNKQGKYYKVKAASADWRDWNWLGNPHKTYDVSSTTDVINIVKDGNAFIIKDQDEYTVKVYTDNDGSGNQPRAIKFEKANQGGGDVTTVDYTKYYVAGLGSGTDKWGTNGLQFDANGKATYTFNSSNAGTKFKLYMSGRTTNSGYFSSDEATYGDGIEATNDGNFKLKDFNETNNTVVTFTLTVSGNKPTLKATWTSGGGDVTGGTKLYYASNIKGNWNGGRDVITLTDGAGSFNLTSDTDIYFCFYSEASNGTMYNAENENILEQNTEYTASNRDNNTSKYHLPAGEWTISVLSYANGEVKFKVSGSEVVIERKYLFIGDLNNWYSEEFTKKPGDGVTIHVGIKPEIITANKDKWRFELVTEEDETGWAAVQQEAGWYKFDKFPDNLLSGQFQIINDLDDDTDKNWGNHEVYSYGYKVTWDNNDNTNPNDEAYKQYYTHPVSKDAIANGTILTSADKGIQCGQGSNIHMDCNAVRNAVVYFKPGNEPKLIISGTPVDYYIFYAMKNDGTGDGDVVEAKINSEKPNKNNYFLPGILYKGWGDQYLYNYVVGEGDNISNDNAHMNTTGIELTHVSNMKDLTRDELFTMFGNYNEELVEGIDKHDLLPNGQSIYEFPDIWYTKIPNGFENPAGWKYNMMFTKARNAEDKENAHVVKCNHMYFFPPDESGAYHVHLDVSAIKDIVVDNTVEVEYRVYNSNKDYITYTVKDNEDGTFEHLPIYFGEIVDSETVEASKELGWNKMVEKDHSLWNKNHTYPEIENWNVCWKENLYNDANTVTDKRQRIPARYSQAYVQFRLKYKVAKGKGDKSINTDHPDYAEHITYLPAKAVCERSEDTYSFNGRDLYVKLVNKGGVLTGVQEIVDDSEMDYSIDPVYFNLQGVRVDNPGKGLYIEVRGNKSRKVMF